MKEFKIIEVNDITTKDGKKFKGYKTIDKNGRKMDVRFTRECQNIPAEPCIICVEDNDCNVDTNRQYPVLWIKNVVSTREFTRRNTVADFFADIVED